MLRWLTIFTLFIFSSFMTHQVFGQDFNRSVITDPSITRRCQSLSNKRKEKINVKQRLQALLSRNLKLQGITPSNKKSVKRKLMNTESHIRHELELAGLKINRLEEDIVRQGCPGIQL